MSILIAVEQARDPNPRARSDPGMPRRWGVPVGCSFAVAGRRPGGLVYSVSHKSHRRGSQHEKVALHDRGGCVRLDRRGRSSSAVGGGGVRIARVIFLLGVSQLLGALGSNGLAFDYIPFQLCITGPAEQLDHSQHVEPQLHSGKQWAEHASPRVE